MKKISLAGLMSALGFTMLFACGGGGGSESLTPSPAAQPTTAVMKIDTTGTLDPRTKIGGILVTGVLPSGVTVKATPDANKPSILVTDSGVVVASGVTGVHASSFATYNATTRKVSIMVYDQDGFGVGEFVTLTCDIASGASPNAGNFGLESFTAKDLNGVQINGLTLGYTIDIH